MISETGYKEIVEFLESDQIPIKSDVLYKLPDNIKLDMQSMIGMVKFIYESIKLVDNPQTKELLEKELNQIIAIMNQAKLTEFEQISLYLNEKVQSAKKHLIDAIKDNLDILFYHENFGKSLTENLDAIKNSRNTIQEIARETYEKYHEHYSALSEIYKSKAESDKSYITWIIIAVVIIYIFFFIFQTLNEVKDYHIFLISISAITTLVGFVLINLFRIYKTNTHLEGQYKHIAASIEFYIKVALTDVLTQESIKFTNDLSNEIFKFHSGLVKEEPAQSINPIELVRALSNTK